MGCAGFEGGNGVLLYVATTTTISSDDFERRRTFEVCVLLMMSTQPSFPTTRYELSVRHRRVAGESANHVTAEVLFMAHAARPLPSNGAGSAASKKKGAILTVVSQVVGI